MLPAHLMLRRGQTHSLPAFPTPPSQLRQARAATGFDDVSRIQSSGRYAGRSILRILNCPAAEYSSD
jgi:hypothetical protein